MIREIYAWCPDAACANALLKSNRALHKLRVDPAAAAQLLMRRQRNDYDAALASCTTVRGGAKAVVQHVMHLLRASPDASACAPTTAPPALLQSALYWASGHHDVAAVRALLALPQPPTVAADNYRALEVALLQAVPQLDVLQALLEGGAPACRSPLDSRALRVAISMPSRLAALQLLGQRCQPAARRFVADLTLLSAILNGNVQALTVALVAAAEAGVRVCEFKRRDEVAAAAEAGNVLALELLLDYRPYSAMTLHYALHIAVTRNRTACAELLLGRGADINHVDCWFDGPWVGEPLQAAIRWAVNRPHWVGRDMVRLLVGRGAVVTAAARRVAAPSADLRALLPAAVA